MPFDYPPLNRIMPALLLAALLAGCGGGKDAAKDDGAAASPDAATRSVAVTDPAPPAFANCRSCHSTEAGQNGIGPTLHGIIGTRAGARQGYAFSPALKASGIIWDRKTLDTWLQGPMKMVPGTRMVMPVPDADKRKAIIDYLETLK